MEDLILELEKNGIEFKVLSDDSIDCEDTLKLESIECIQKYKVYAYVDDFDTGKCRNHIEK
ncbi:MAG: hypothetical protein IKS48_00500 [Eubacterium sp.]|nr:hypothetical protein [Eubacterium sp.]